MLRFLSPCDILAPIHLLAPKYHDPEKVLSEEDEETYSVIEDLSKIEEVLYLSSML
jgi:hypothetical protein